MRVEAVSSEITTDLYIANQIKQLNVTEKGIAELRKKYGELRIASYSDKDGYEIVKAARLAVRAYRTCLEKKRKELVENPLMIQRAINDEAKKRTLQIEQIESFLYDQEKDYEHEAERVKAEKKRLEEYQMNMRIQALTQVGFYFDGKLWTAKLPEKGYEVTVDDLKSLKETEFLTLMDKFSEKYDRDQQAARDEKERLAAIEEKKILDRKLKEKEEREALEIERKKLAEQHRINEEKLKSEREQFEAERALENEERLKAAKENEKIKVENLRLAEKQRKMEAEIEAKTEKPQLEPIIEEILPLFETLLKEMAHGYEFVLPGDSDYDELIKDMFIDYCSEKCLDIDYREAARKIIQREYMNENQTI